MHTSFNQVDREAMYVNGSETDVLLFQYVVEVGDNTSMLDYWSDQQDWRWYDMIKNDMQAAYTLVMLQCAANQSSQR